jgi:phosphomannomutase
LQFGSGLCRDNIRLAASRSSGRRRKWESDLCDITTLHLTRIGSPFVIAAMEEVLAHDITSTPGGVAGYEANGGFLLGTAAAGPLLPLMTRDCLLPMLAPLARARAMGRTLTDLVAELPPRFTTADRLQGITPEASVDRTDGLRVTFSDAAILHLRPSGNAPEFRCYAEAETPARAASLLAIHLDRLREALG